jgi:hypothetical protein
MTNRVRVVCARGEEKAAVEQLNVSTEIQGALTHSRRVGLPGGHVRRQRVTRKNGIGRSEALGRQRGSSVACNANPCMSMAFK